MANIFGSHYMLSAVLTALHILNILILTAVSELATLVPKQED